MNNNVNTRLIVLKILKKVFDEGAYANIELNKILGKNDLIDENRRFITELVYGTIKAKGTIDWIIENNVTRKLGKISPVILNILRLGVYQIFFNDKTPDSAACNESVKLAKKFGHQGTVKFVNGVLRNCSRNKETLEYPSEKDNLIKNIALTKFHPEWLVKRWLEVFGEDETRALCEYNNVPKKIVIRVNTLMATREELMGFLEEEGFEVTLSKWSKDGIVCTKSSSLKNIFYKYGDLIYIQDESSMLVGEIVQPIEGSRVIDVCSAPGGKTTHLAQLMNNKGEIIASDIHEHKLKLIDENADRLRIDIIETKLQDASINVAEWNNSADYVLVDAPCSGTGVLGRRAEARWRKAEADLKEFPKLQIEILNNASKYTKVGGTLIYSTCSIEKAENTEVVESFLKTNKNYKIEKIHHPITGELINELKILPQKDNIDGFYICKLIKNEES